jgi:hypothetical protein
MVIFNSYVKLPEGSLQLQLESYNLLTIRGMSVDEPPSANCGSAASVGYLGSTVVHPC